MNTARDSVVSQLKSICDNIVSSKAKFDDLATRLSDCSSAKRGGNLDICSKGSPHTWTQKEEWEKVMFEDINSFLQRQGRKRSKWPLPQQQGRVGQERNPPLKDTKGEKKLAPKN
ncbi:peptidyl-prolyl cis-trans isomerase pin1 [Quercus suber]|uniref:Peptidyl-prolyl cis-trans isomerase n=1 Tax=Quercus suber TaxID=58331 RepID=A0AAW0L5N7_QUESU